MREMQVLEYAFLVQELQPLTGRRLDRIYNLGESRLRLKIGDADLIIELGRYIYLARQIPESTELDNFTQKVRKEIEGKRIEKIIQANRDRTIVFECGDYRLIFEMFAQGNAVLVRGETILACYRNGSWKDRTIKPGEPYRFPSSRSVENVRGCLSSRYVAADLARLPYGTLYVKEALARCRIDERKPGTALQEDETACLENTFQQFERDAKPCVFYQEDRPVDYGLLPFLAYAAFTIRAFPKLSEALELCALVPDETPDAAFEKLQRRLQKQKENREKLLREETDARQKGDAIYAHYHQAEAALAEAKKQRKREIEVEL